MKRFLCGVLAVLLPAALCACGTQETATVRLSEVTHSVFYAPQYVALEQGFFADEGLKIELSNGGGADKVMTAVVSGQADIGLAGPEASIYVAQQGKEDPPVIFAQLTRRDGSFLVGRSDGPFRWENLRGSTIIGGRAGGVPEMTLEYVLRQHGLTPGEDVTVDTSVQFNMMAGAFTGGGGDYVTLFEPTATEVEQAGKGYILCSIGQESGEIPYTAYFANRSYLTANAGTVQRFTNAIARAQRWVAEHTDREEPIHGWMWMSLRIWPAGRWRPPTRRSSGHWAGRPPICIRGISCRMRPTSCGVPIFTPTIAPCSCGCSADWCKS